MPDEELTEIRTLLDTLINEAKDAGGSQASLKEVIGEVYANELSKMTDAEAVQHLRSLDGLKLLPAYLFLSMRMFRRVVAEGCLKSMLAEVCLKYMASSILTDRMMGASDIGIWLEGTNDKKASRALALMVRNTEETDRDRLSAYSSLQLINNKASPMDCLRRSTRPTIEAYDLLEEIDWIFVDSFL